MAIARALQRSHSASLPDEIELTPGPRVQGGAGRYGPGVLRPNGTRRAQERHPLGRKLSKWLMVVGQRAKLWGLSQLAVML